MVYVYDVLATESDGSTRRFECTEVEALRVGGVIEDVETMTTYIVTSVVTSEIDHVGEVEATFSFGGIWPHSGRG
jgi:hypothetical protein